MLFDNRRLEEEISHALRVFWMTRHRQARHSEDKGNRAAVTGGRQLDGFVTLIRELLCANGVPKEAIFTDVALELPGYYRPNKKWDLLVVREKRLLAALEFKSQVGPSFGNNFNNRAEEALGSATDLWTAYREGVFGTNVAPWVGYFMLVEDCKASTTPVAVRSAHFPVLEEFRDVSYLRRYEIFCKKLMLERQYSATCLMTTSFHAPSSIHYGFPDEALSLQKFLFSLLAATCIEEQR